MPDTACLFKVLKYHAPYAESLPKQETRGPSTFIQNWIDIPWAVFREAGRTKSYSYFKDLYHIHQKQRVQTKLPLKTCLCLCSLNAVLLSEEVGPKVQIHFCEIYCGIYLYHLGKLASMSVFQLSKGSCYSHSKTLLYSRPSWQSKSFSKRYQQLTSKEWNRAGWRETQVCRRVWQGGKDFCFLK